MSRSSMRRLAAVAASGALVASGLAVGVIGGAGVATAAETCNQTAHASKNDASTWWITHNYDKTVSAATASGGTNITYKTVVGTTGIGNPYLNTFIDYPPAGFAAPVKAQVTSYTAIAVGQHTDDVTPVPNGDGGFKVTNTGWFISASSPVTVEFTYKVPNDVQVGGQVFDSGIHTNGTVGIGENLRGLKTCFTGRIANPGEGVTGSMDMAGLGSSENQLSSTGSVSDVLGDAISRVLKNGS